MTTQNPLSGKRILLAGAAGGIGRACAAILVRQGAQVIASDLASKAPAALKGRSVRYLPADLRHETQIQALCKKSAAIWNGLDGLLNCACVLDKNDTGALDMPLDSWQATLDVNLSAAFLLSKYTLPFLQKRRTASIVHVSSIVAWRGSAQSQLAYTASKGGLEAMVREIAVAYAHKNIRANCVAPGPVRTKRNASFFASREQLDTRLAHIPMARLGQADEIANACAFLLSDAASYITAITLPVDGGLMGAYLAQRG